jgi:demethylmenaquinone methyltransferase / 2-methoxy-6-polyprenyl-1,4-benzoquinol methylase
VTPGARPAGSQSPQQTAQWVRTMFDRVAPRYDLLNHLLSMEIDRYWRARTVRETSHVLRRPNARVLDTCCGTGDLLFALEKRRGGGVYGTDFSHRMLTSARTKAQRMR